MSNPTIAPYFPIRRIKIINQDVMSEAAAAHIHMRPNKRFAHILQLKPMGHRTQKCEKFLTLTLKTVGRSI